MQRRGFPGNAFFSACLRNLRREPVTGDLLVFTIYTALPYVKAGSLIGICFGFHLHVSVFQGDPGLIYPAGWGIRVLCLHVYFYTTLTGPTVAKAGYQRAWN